MIQTPADKAGYQQQECAGHLKPGPIGRWLAAGILRYASAQAALQVGQAVVGGGGGGHFQTFQYLRTTLTIKDVRFHAVLSGWCERTGHVLPQQGYGQVPTGFGRRK